MKIPSLGCAAVLLLGAAARAQTPQPDDAADADQPPVTVEDLRQQMQELETRLDETRNIATFRRPIVTVAGYVDFGFFVPTGEGVGVVQDEGPNRAFPAYANQYA